MRRICVFCGSSPGARPIYAETARLLGRTLAERGLGLVYGGAHIGLMGLVTDAALAGGGEVIGVIPESLLRREVGHHGLSELRVVGSMHERKAVMADLADAFIALPGGYGTFEEFCEVLTWAQLGLHRKPCGILNVAGYYDRLLALFDQAVTEGFVAVPQRALVLAESDVEGLLSILAASQPPVMEAWLGRDEI